MGGSPSFDLKKFPFLRDLPSKLGYEVESGYVHLVSTIDVRFGRSRLFSFISTRLSLKEVVFLVEFLHFYHFLSLFLA